MECSRLYNLLVDKLQNADAELERYRTLTDSLEVIFSLCYFSHSSPFLRSFHDRIAKILHLYTLFGSILKLLFQADRPHVMRREKELNLKAESSDAARKVVDNPESRIQELELQLQRCMLERNELEIRMEEAIQDSGKKNLRSMFFLDLWDCGDLTGESCIREEGY